MSPFKSTSVLRCLIYGRRLSRLLSHTSEKLLAVGIFRVNQTPDLGARSQDLADSATHTRLKFEQRPTRHGWLFAELDEKPALTKNRAKHLRFLPHLGYITNPGELQRSDKSMIGLRCGGGSVEGLDGLIVGLAPAFALAFNDGMLGYFGIVAIQKPTTLWRGWRRAFPGMDSFEI